MDNKSTESGLGFGTVLFLIFLVLKLTEVIDWSWFWVTSPLWIPVVIIMVVLLVSFIILFRK